MPHPHFLQIPFEIRLIIYRLVLQDHTVVKRRHQPNNNHLRVLHTCSQVYYEADHVFRQYVSLSREEQMLAFHHCATDSQKAQVLHADVANDGRTIEDLSSNKVTFRVVFLVFTSADRWRIRRSLSLAYLLHWTEWHL
jgi:hypothetical protein